MDLCCDLCTSATTPSLSCPQVALIHLFQAGMFADRVAVTALTDTDETTPRMRSAAGERLPVPLRLGFV